MTDTEPTSGDGDGATRPASAVHRRSAPVGRGPRGGRGPLAGRVGRALLALVAGVCLVVTGVGWTMVHGLNRDLSSAGELDIGKDVLDGAVDILLVGTDNRTDAQGNPLSPEELAMLRTGVEDTENTDTILLIRIPKDGSSATAISIPRDTYVQTRTIGKSKINGVYGATKELAIQKAEQSHADGKATPAEVDKAVQSGRNALINSVKDLTGVEVDHYAEIGLLGFVLLTDAVGGVPVCLNADVDEPLSGAHFHAGVQTVHGSDALSFVRQRHDLPAGDLDRIVRQQVYMAQLVKKILSAGTLTDPAKLNKLTDAARRSFVIDENWDFVDFAMKLKDMSGGNVKFETIPVTAIDGVGDYGESVVVVDQAKVAAFVRSLGGSGVPSATAGPGAAPTTAPSGPEPSTVTVQVVNATAREGLAQQVARTLTGRGYVEGEVWSEPGGAYTSHVSAASAGDRGAFAVAEALGGLPVQVDPAVPAGSVRVVLADDYTGPTGETETTGAESTTQTSETTSYAPLPPSIAKRPTFDAGDGSVPCVN